MEENQKTLIKIKKDKIVGPKYEEMTSKVSAKDMKFLETGTDLKNNIFKSIMKTLLNENMEQYKMLAQREREKKPQIKKIVRELKEKIFDDKFTLYRETDGKNIANL